jgi:hypothetical protein
MYSLRCTARLKQARGGFINPRFGLFRQFQLQFLSLPQLFGSNRPSKDIGESLKNLRANGSVWEQQGSREQFESCERFRICDVAG